LPLTHVDVELSVAKAAVEITASAETTAQTGVEMEALVAATVAALTVYDMAKAVDDGMELSEVRLVEKSKEPV
jgi:cyclic pyranopterin phosphate synthase